MTRTPLRYLLLPFMMLAVAAASASGVLNPHVEPASCPSCHTKVPTVEEGQAGEYFLIKDTIDDTCHVCHEKTCCKPGSLHGVNHPSNIDTWDRAKFRTPKTLPLYGGYITCDTCHLHRAAQGSTYKLVRIVTVDGLKIDWTALCHDCHLDY
jgi:hypothetical protein